MEIIIITLLLTAHFCGLCQGFLHLTKSRNLKPRIDKLTLSTYSQPEIKSAENVSRRQQRLKVLVLGGTGFVGRRFIETTLKQYDECSIVSVSRRGRLPNEIESDSRVNWIAADATSESEMKNLNESFGPFDVCIHAIGLLLDSESGLSDLNRFASGSSSQPGADSTYDKITRKTAFVAIDAMERQSKQDATFVFISAAEAGWTIDTPIPWLNRYLGAKRAVEQKLRLSNLRSVIFRPSLVWTLDRPQALFSVAPFYIASALGVPFIDRPVLVETLARAMVAAIGNNGVSGVKRYDDIESLGKKCPENV